MLMVLRTARPVTLRARTWFRQFPISEVGVDRVARSIDVSCTRHGNRSACNSPATSAAAIQRLLLRVDIAEIHVHQLPLELAERSDVFHLALGKEVAAPGTQGLRVPWAAFVLRNDRLAAESSKNGQSPRPKSLASSFSTRRQLGQTGSLPMLKPGPHTNIALVLVKQWNINGDLK